MVEGKIHVSAGIQRQVDFLQVKWQGKRTRDMLTQKGLEFEDLSAILRMKSSAVIQMKYLNLLPAECLECRLSSVLGLRGKILQCV